LQKVIFGQWNPSKGNWLFSKVFAIGLINVVSYNGIQPLLSFILGAECLF
jgi:hypothetical protein